jgi:integrase
MTTGGIGPMAKKKRGGGEGTVGQDASGRWYGKVSLGFCPDTGKRLRKTVYGKTQKEVLQKIREVVAGKEKGQDFQVSKATVTEYLTYWISDVVSVQRATRTVLGYKEQIRLRLKPYIGNRKLAKLKPVHIQSWLGNLKRDGHSNHKIHETFAVLRNAMNAAVRLQMLPYNPCLNVEESVPDKSQPKPVEPLTADQSNSLAVECWDHRVGALPMVGILTGLRTGELLALEWEDIVWAKKTIKLSRALSDWGSGYEIKTPKSGKSRPIAIGDDCILWLRRRQEFSQQEGLHDCKLVFPNTRGDLYRRTNLRKQVWMPLCEQADIRGGLEGGVKFHDLRHTHASLLIAAQAHPKVISEKLGHADVGFTMKTYAHLYDEAQAEAAEAMESLLAKPGGPTRGPKRPKKKR